MRAQPLSLCREPSWTEIGTCTADGERGDPFLQPLLGLVAIAMEPQDPEFLGLYALNPATTAYKPLRLSSTASCIKAARAVDGSSWCDSIKLRSACRARVLQVRGRRVVPSPMKNSLSLPLSVFPSAHVRQMQ